MTGPLEPVSANLILRGTEVNVTYSVVEPRTLEIEVEDASSGEEWQGRFTADYLEQMTHKTGNFKKFDVFVDMLHTVLTENDPSLSVDLMTFTNLQELRSQKKGGGSRLGSRSAAASRANERNRYLILIYTAPFDRIYFPLPLHYQGRPDPVQLKATILALRAELAQSQGGREIRQLRQEARNLRLENEKLRRDLEQMQEQQLQVDGALLQSEQRQESRALKAVIAGLEEDLSVERSRAQKLQAKLTRERNQLREEAEEARASERLLRVRVRTLVNELALYKRDRVHRDSGSPAGSVRSMPASPRFLNPGRPRDRPPQPRPWNTSSSSSERLAQARARSASPRFNPTAYVTDLRRRREEAQERHAREIRARLGGGGSYTRSRTPSPASSRAGSASSRRSQRPQFRSYLSSEDEADERADSDSTASLLTASSRGGRPPVVRRAPAAVVSTPRSDRSSERRPRPPPPDRPSRARARKPEAANRKWRAGEGPLEVTGKGLGGSYHLEEMRDIDERINKLNHFLTQVIQERA